MKTIEPVCIIVISALIAVSCALDPETGTGSEGSLYLTLAGQARGSEETARIYLITTDDELVPIGDDTDYRDVSIAGGQTTVTISGLPVGPEYQAFFALGKQETGYFSVSRYAVSDAFELSPGDNVSVPKLTLRGNPVNNSDQIMGKNLKGVVVDGGNIYAPTNSTLYVGSSVDAMSGAYALPGGHSANSISIGDETIGGVTTKVWINTNRGILPYDGSGAFDQDITLNLGVVSILDSGAYYNGTSNFLYFQRDGGLGGIEVTTTPPSGTWLNIDLSDVITGQPIKDLAVKNTNSSASVAYFASKLGTFALKSGIFGSGSADFLDADYSKFIEVGSNNAPVIALAYGGISNDIFVLGTEEGVWTSSNPLAGSTLVSGTQSKRFVLVAVAATTGHWAALSEHWLYIDNADDPYPFHAGFPGTITGMAWTGEKLVISGTEGLVELTP